MSVPKPKILIDLHKRTNLTCEITEQCKVCPHVTVWGGNKYMPAEYHCTLVLYKDHTGTASSFPCDFLEKEDCPINRTTLADF